MTIQVIPIHVKNDVQPADSLVELLLSSSKVAFEEDSRSSTKLSAG